MSTTETKVTHTPGPWKLGAPSKRRMMGTDEVEIQSENGSMIALLYRHNWADQDEPNAHLIAAAPDMLEALEEGERELSEFFATYVTNGVGVDDGTSNVLQKLRKAISRAKGGAA